MTECKRLHGLREEEKAQAAAELDMRMSTGLPGFATHEFQAACLARSKYLMSGDIEAADIFEAEQEEVERACQRSA